MALDPNPIEAQLKAELDDSRNAWAEARAEMRKIISEIPSGFPHPDGVARIGNAGAREKAAAAVYFATLKRFTDFMLQAQAPAKPKKACVYCGNETELYVINRPVCIRCAEDLDAGRTLSVPTAHHSFDEQSG